MSLTQSNVANAIGPSGGGGWIKGRENMKMTEIKEILGAFEEDSVLRTKDKPENLQDLVAVSWRV